MILLSHALTRLLALIFLATCAIASLLFATAAVIGSKATASLAGSAGLTGVAHEISGFLRRTAPPPDSTALALGAAATIFIAVVILAGTLVPVRRRDIARSGEPGLSVRSGALANATAAALRRTPGAATARVHAKGGRLTHRGRLRIRATQSPQADAGAVRAALRQDARGITDGFAVAPRVRVRVGRSKAERTQ